MPLQSAGLTIRRISANRYDVFCQRGSYSLSKIELLNF
jgi:hypothetical protein